MQVPMKVEPSKTGKSHRIYVLINRHWMRYNFIEYESDYTARQAAKRYAKLNGYYLQKV